MKNILVSATEKQLNSSISDTKTREYQQRLNQGGFVYIDNLNSNFDWLNYTRKITNKRLMLQDNSELIYNVKATSNNTLSNSKSQNSLRPHTEASYLDSPPKYLALWCRQPSACGGGYTTLANAHSLLNRLTSDEQKRLREQLYLFINEDGSRKIYAPIVQLKSARQLLFRFSYNILMFQNPSPDLNSTAIVADKFLQDICDRVLEFFESDRIEIRLEKHSLLIVNNSTMVHSRTAYQDPNRFMQRIWLQ